MSSLYRHDSQKKRDHFFSSFSIVPQPTLIWLLTHHSLIISDHQVVDDSLSHLLIRHPQPTGHCPLLTPSGNSLQYLERQFGMVVKSVDSGSRLGVISSFAAYLLCDLCHHFIIPVTGTILAPFP